MKNKVFLLIVLISLGVALPNAIRKPKPTFRGKNAEQWLMLYSKSRINLLMASNAFHHLGSAGIAILGIAAFASTENPPLKSFWFQARESLPSRMQGDMVSDKRKVDAARELIRTLKPPAPNIFPTLERATQANDREKRRIGYWLMGYLGEGSEIAVAALIRGLDDPDAEAKSAAIYSLGQLGEKAAAAIPSLTPFINVSNIFRSSAGWALARMGPAGKKSSDSLHQCFTLETDLLLKLDLAAALFKMDSTHTAALDHLHQAVLQSNNLSLKRGAIRYLALSKEQRSIALLTATAKEGLDNINWLIALFALSTLQPDVNVWRQLVTELGELKDVERSRYLVACRQWQKADPANPEPVNRLLLVAVNPGEPVANRYEAVMYLKDLILSKADLDRLRNLARHDQNEAIRVMAGEVLDQYRY